MKFHNQTDYKKGYPMNEETKNSHFPSGNDNFPWHTLLTGANSKNIFEKINETGWVLKKTLHNNDVEVGPPAQNESRAKMSGNNSSIEQLNPMSNYPIYYNNLDYEKNSTILLHQFLNKRPKGLAQIRYV